MVSSKVFVIFDVDGTINQTEVYAASHKKLIDKFYQAIEEGTQEYVHVKDAVMSIRLIDAIKESGRTGKTVEIKEK